MRCLKDVFVSLGCGKIFCDTCTSGRAIVPLFESNVPERVCNPCYSNLKTGSVSPIYHTTNVPLDPSAANQQARDDHGEWPSVNESCK